MVATNILIIASRANIAGGETYLLSCLRYLDRTRYHPIVWLPGDGAFRSALEAASVEHFIDPANYGWLKPDQAWFDFLSGLPKRVRRLSDLMRHRDIRLVHTNSNQILEGALAARRVGVPHLYLAHINFQPNIPLYERFPLDPLSFAQLIGDLSDGIIAVSNQVADALCPPLSRDRVRVVSNGLEIDRYDQALRSVGGALRTSLGLDDNSVLVVAAGRITEDKGFDVLIDAAASVCSAYPNAYFLICGASESKDYHASLLRQVESRRLAQRVLFLGRRGDLPEIMAQSDVFALSSRREGHPYVLLEAMACNLPCVATRCGGVEETIVEGKTGFSVAIGNAQELAEQLSILLASPTLRKEMGVAAGRDVRNRFTASMTAQGLFDMYDYLIEQQRSSRGAYSVDLLLQAAMEIGHLGSKLTALEPRIRRAEHVADLILDNPLSRFVRKILKRDA